MNIYPVGDYYAWYCDWCDTKNLTVWTRIDEEELTCGACHHRSSASDQADSDGDASLAACI